MIALLHRSWRGGGGGGSLGTPKSDYVICARPLTKDFNDRHSRVGEAAGAGAVSFVLPLLRHTQ